MAKRQYSADSAPDLDLMPSLLPAIASLREAPLPIARDGDPGGSPTAPGNTDVPAASVSISIILPARIGLNAAAAAMPQHPGIHIVSRRTRH
jgi:hypothetical protein